MKKFNGNNKNKGFTVVELVIVIAVIAILATVLIAIFSNVIKSAHHSKDIQRVNIMNKTLAIEFVSNGNNVDYSAVVNALKSNRIEVPAKPDSDGCVFYWMPSVNKVVYYDSEKNAVDYPETYKDATKDETWIDMSTGMTSEESDTPTESQTSGGGETEESKTDEEKHKKEAEEHFKTPFERFTEEMLEWFRKLFS